MTITLTIICSIIILIVFCTLAYCCIRFSLEPEQSRNITSLIFLPRRITGNDYSII